MSIYSFLSANFPKTLKKSLRPYKRLLIKQRKPLTKYESELNFWRSRLELDSGLFRNSHYKNIMLAMADKVDEQFIAGKIVADFGCGPRGSLVWAKSAALRIGIDVLTDLYADEFAENLTQHDMIYIKSTEKVIPLPSGFVDVLYTLNAIDHVDNFKNMSQEIVRVLKPGGLFIGSFNMEEPSTAAEPQCLTEEDVKKDLLDKLVIKSYRISSKGPTDNPYKPFFDNNLSYKKGQEGFLWVIATKTL